VLLDLLTQKSSKVLLVDHKTFSEELLPSDFITNIRLLDFKLWVLPQAIEGFRTEPELAAKYFNSVKKEIFSEYLCQTKLYNIPNDISILKSEFRTAEFAC
jgi:hypothetical protein